MNTARIFLIGYRGTGKSTVGRALADRLGWRFLDADTALETAAQTSITQIFATEGEPGFRDRESAILETLSQTPTAVIATGGGVILRPANRERLHSHGFTVWLTATPETCWERMQTDPTTGQRRPNLTATGGLEEVRTLLAFREPLYRAVAHATFDTEADSPETLAAAILEAWAAHAAP